MIPRTIKRGARSLLATCHTRAFGSSTRVLSSNKFMFPPAPPKLPKKQQEEWEELQRRAAQGTSEPSYKEQQVATGASDAEARLSRSDSGTNQSSGVMHPDMRKGAAQEFEGEVNPKTGEVGGPKNEPLRWGAKGDWSYNGRVTDF
jgi:hypothetical protein